ncbi:MAG TPA: polysaccharide biosynthesis/export family protein [Pyrinomonadaceae bacterium]
MRLLHIGLGTSLIIASAAFSPAQQRKTETSEIVTPETSSTSQVPIRDERYRIGPGDVLEVRVFNRPQLSRDAARVDGRGLVAMPLIDEGIQAACKTESELAHDIEIRYLKYQRNPHVNVFVKEFNSRPVAVIGAVNQPGRFQLQRRVRLLELLAFAGGPSERAGDRIDIIRTSTAECRASTAMSDRGDLLATELISFKLADTLMGDDKANPYVQSEDIISMPEAGQAFVVGNVLRPTAINLKDPVTVSRAIAMAGGVMPDSKLNRIRIVRPSPQSGAKAEIFVDLRAVEKRQAEDVALQSGDIVDVEASGSKRFLRTLFSAIAPAAANVPVRIVR